VTHTHTHTHTHPHTHTHTHTHLDIITLAQLVVGEVIVLSKVENNVEKIGISVGGRVPSIVVCVRTQM
jgi:hypothetical protein